jgi:hypothetical protein
MGRRRIASLANFTIFLIHVFVFIPLFIYNMPFFRFSNPPKDEKID